ncbi:DUF1656 domain-containing protein [Martelella endophytica]|uniref:Membrane protein n=1 Tax=Martelella endophytica TaxID=1486262 RepID=A0A0D5LMB6_MAREN|nr:DUF1656 domain-containing protein [Martelella endophytica]AJY45100.1 membrane protein [Martelella endophytica]
MTGQIDLCGVFIPSLAALALAAYIVFRALVSVLVKVGFYRMVWHRALFDGALYLMLFGFVSIALDWFQT